MAKQKKDSNAMRLLCFLFYLGLITGEVAANDAINPKDPDALKPFCAEMRVAVKKLKWKIEPCEGIDWKFSDTSVKGRPIVYAVFGADDQKAKNKTLILSTIHGDEITPAYLGFEMARYLKDNPFQDAETQVIIAPLVNPDSFLSSPRKRVNANGVDVNRNFPTKDWSAEAHTKWIKRFKSDPRRNPGKIAGSEPETKFQQDMVTRFRPDKILAIHAPLNFLDYDGPNYLALDRFSTEYVKECLKLRQSLKATSQGFYPGSLGNYAGQELGIPTITLELPSANPAKAKPYWEQFRQGIESMIQYKVLK